MQRIIKYLVLSLPLLFLLLTSCDNKEEKANKLVSEYLKTNGIQVKEYNVKTSQMSEAKQVAVNDSAVWSLVSQWVGCIRQIDSETNQGITDQIAHESLLQVGFIIANEYVDSINYRIKQLNPNKTLGYEFIQDASVTLDNNKQKDIKFRIITDSRLSKILLLVPLSNENEKVFRIIDEAQKGNLTKLPVDPQTEAMYYLSTGKNKPSF